MHLLHVIVIAHLTILAKMQNYSIVTLTLVAENLQE